MNKNQLWDRERKTVGVTGLFDGMAVGLFIFSIALHALLLWVVLPPARFIKYQIAVYKYLEGTLPLERLLDFSPLYLGIHLLCARMFSSPDTVILGLQVLATALASVFLFKLIAYHFTRKVALIGTLLFILNHSVIIYTGTFEPEPFILFFLLGFLYFAHLDGRAGPIGGGLFLALCLLTRPNYSPLILVFPFFYYFKHQGKNWVQPTVRWAGPVLLAVFLLLLRGTALTGTFTPFAMNPGYVFYEGNNPASLGESAVYPYSVRDARKDFAFDTDFRHELYRIVARRTTQSMLTVRKVNDFWMEKAKHFILASPGHTLSLLATKIVYIFHDFKRHDIFYLYQKGAALKSVLPEIPFAVVSAMSLLGLFLFRKRWKEGLLIYTSLFIQVGAMLVIYVSERQRLAILPLLVFFSCAVLHRLFRREGIKWIIPLVVLLTAFLYTKNDYMKDKLHVVARMNRGTEALGKASDYRNKGDWAEAARANATALAFTPWSSEEMRLAGVPFKNSSIEKEALQTALSLPKDSHSALFDLATLYLQSHRFDEAESILKKLIQDNRRFNRRSEQSSQPEFYLGRLYALKKEYPAAIDHLKKALSRNPGEPWVLSYLFALSGQEPYKQALYRYFDDISAAFLIGQAFYDLGKNRAAVPYFEYTVKTLPEYRKARIYLSLALARTGEVNKAADLFIQAVNRRNEPLFHENAVVQMFRDRVAQAPKNLEAAQELATTLRLFGRYEEAENVSGREGE